MGKSASEGKGISHAVTIISGDFGITNEKIKALKHAGALIEDTSGDVSKLIRTIREEL